MTCDCCASPNQKRLAALRPVDALPVNAIDYVEVRDHDEATEALRQRTLFVYFLRAFDDPTLLAGAVVPPGLDNLLIDGGTRIPVVGVEWAFTADGPDRSATEPEWPDYVASVDPAVLNRVLIVRTVEAGDFATYSLRLVKTVAGRDDTTLPGYDPLLAVVPFSFKVECPSSFDCAPRPVTPLAAGDGIEIDYLAKDYDGFRRVMIERMSQLVPGWVERNPADETIMLVESLAYLADELSYRQDAVATEAFLGTARSRVSLRRLALLVDYRIHEGCNAAVWAKIDPPGTPPTSLTIPVGTGLATPVAGLPARMMAGSDAARDLIAAGPVWYETTAEKTVFSEAATLDFYTRWWQGEVLAAGATAATLLGDVTAFVAAGDVLVLAESADPLTGSTVDADPAHRWAVRLTSVTVAQDPVGSLFDDVPAGSGGVGDPVQPLAVTELTWDAADALPFELCLVVPGTSTPAAVALGNIVLADHGRTLMGVPLVPVPDPPHPLTYAEDDDGCCPDDGEPEEVPRRYRPVLPHGPLTWARPWDPDAPASAITIVDPRTARPAFGSVVSTSGNLVQHWTCAADLLEAGVGEPLFVVETEYDGTATLRFGDQTAGLPPAPGATFTADYRVGNGAAGRVGRSAFGHIVFPIDPGDVEVALDNPLPSVGGVAPEVREDVLRDAPAAFTTQDRAVTMADYADRTQTLPGIQRAAATLRWTGSWQTVFVSVDRLGGADVDAAFEASVVGQLDRYRMAGYDLDINSAVFVPLEIDVTVCADAQAVRDDVEHSVRTALGTGALFSPDRWTVGQTVYLSAVYDAVMRVPGVATAEVTTFQRLQQPDGGQALVNGRLPMEPLEVARLDNDPDFPERGTLTLSMGGGR